MNRFMARVTALPGVRTALPLLARFVRQQIRRGWRFLVATRVRLAMTTAAVLVATVAGAWYATRPEPHYVTFVAQPPGLTEYDERAVMSIKPLTVTFRESAAPLKQLQKVVSAGITMSPAMDDHGRSAERDVDVQIRH